MTKIKAVIGANYGDEGKGLTTAYFGSKIRKGRGIVVLTNGGAQRGHTVEYRGDKHIFHHFGSCGPDNPIDVFIPSHFCINPIEFIKEIDALDADKWSTCGLRVIAKNDAPVTTPYDMFVNQILELNRGNNRHGSTGMGIWTTLQRNKVIPFRCEDLMNRSLDGILDEIIQYSYKVLDGMNIPDEYKELFEDKGLRDHFKKDCEIFDNMTELCREYRLLSCFDEVIFENAQGLLLNFEEGNQHTTPSFTGITNINEIAAEIESIEDAEICYVTRTYLTRHGAGPFPTECGKDAINPDINDNTNVYNKWQEFIRYGKLDIDELNERIDEDFEKCTIQGAKKSVMLTHFNENEIDVTKIKDLKYISSNKDFDKVLSLF